MSATGVGMSECEHKERVPNPGGGAWWCPRCDAYPLIGPSKEEFKRRFDAGEFSIAKAVQS